MQLESLRVAQFRNLNQVEIDTDAPFVVFHGDNGQGKTNLIEAIGTLATLKSFRTHRVADQIQWGAASARIEGKIREEGHRRDLTVNLSKDGRKARIDGKSPKQLLDYFESIRAVVFAPEHVELVRGAPDQRRGFLDRGCFNSQAAYLNHFREFKRLLAQRAALLRGPAFSGPQMEVLEEQLALSGARVSTRRARFVEALANPFREVHTQLTGQQDVSIRYRSSLGEGSESERAENYLQLMRQRREEEHQRGSNLVGPQRDDLVLQLFEKNARHFASQGQARALVIALKLSELEIACKNGVKPLFLLDDLSSELDAKRRGKLLEILESKDLQVFISTTSLSILESYSEKIKQFRVDKGSVIEE